MVTIECDNKYNDFLFLFCLSRVTREYQMEYLIYNST